MAPTVLTPKKVNRGPILKPKDGPPTSNQCSEFRKRKRRPVEVPILILSEIDTHVTSVTPYNSTSGMTNETNGDDKIADGKSSGIQPPQSIGGKRGSKTQRQKLAKPTKEKDAEVFETPYRSSLGGIITLIKDLKLTNKHKDVLKRTPFWLMFEAIIDDKLTLAQCRKSDKMIIEIINAYDPVTEKFRIGRKSIEVTRDDMVRIFGISCGNKVVNLKYGARDDVKMVTRRKMVHTRLTTPVIKDLLREYVVKNEKDDIEDVARLLCLYLCHTFFFPNGTTVKWVHLQCIEDLQMFGDYDWCGAIVNELMTSIRKHHLQPRKVSGCVMALLYWLCENTDVVKPLHTEVSLAVVKWSIPAMESKFRKRSLSKLKAGQDACKGRINIKGAEKPEYHMAEERDTKAAHGLMELANTVSCLPEINLLTTSLNNTLAPTTEKTTAQLVEMADVGIMEHFPDSIFSDNRVVAQVFIPSAQLPENNLGLSCVKPLASVPCEPGSNSDPDYENIRPDSSFNPEDVAFRPSKRAKLTEDVGGEDLAQQSSVREMQTEELNPENSLHAEDYEDVCATGPLGGPVLEQDFDSIINRPELASARFRTSAPSKDMLHFRDCSLLKLERELHYQNFMCSLASVELFEKAHDLEQEKNKLSGILANVRADLTELEGKRQRENRDSEEKIQELNSVVEQMKEEKSKWESAFEESNAERNRMAEDLASVSGKVKFLLDEKNGIEAEMSLLRERLDSAGKEKKLAEDEVLKTKEFAESELARLEQKKLNDIKVFKEEFRQQIKRKLLEEFTLGDEKEIAGVGG